MSPPFQPYGHQGGRYYNRESVDTTGLWLGFAVVVLLICVFQPLRDFVAELFHMFLETVGLDWLLLPYYRCKQRVSDTIRWLYFKFDAPPALEKEEIVREAAAPASVGDAAAQKSRQVRLRRGRRREPVQSAQATGSESQTASSISSGAAAMPSPAPVETVGEAGFEPVLSPSQRKAMRKHQQQDVQAQTSQQAPSPPPAVAYPDYWLTFDPILGLVPLKDVDSLHRQEADPSFPAPLPMEGTESSSSAIDPDALPDLRPSHAHRSKDVTNRRQGKGKGVAKTVKAGKVKVADAAQAVVTVQDDQPQVIGAAMLQQDDEDEDDEDGEDLPLPPAAARSIAHLARRQTQTRAGRKDDMQQPQKQSAQPDPSIETVNSSSDDILEGDGWTVQRGSGKLRPQQAARQDTAEADGDSTEEAGAQSRSLPQLDSQSQSAAVPDAAGLRERRELVSLPGPSSLGRRALPADAEPEEEKEERLALEMRMLQRQWEHEYQEEQAAEEGWETVPNTKR